MANRIFHTGGLNDCEALTMVARGRLTVRQNFKNSMSDFFSNVQPASMIALARPQLASHQCLIHLQLLYLYK